MSGNISKITVGSTSYSVSQGIYGICNTATGTTPKDVSLYYKENSITIPDKNCLIGARIPIFFNYGIERTAATTLTISGLSWTLERNYSGMANKNTYIRAGFVPVYFYNSSYCEVSYNPFSYLNDLQCNGINPSSSSSIRTPYPKYIISDFSVPSSSLPTSNTAAWALAVDIDVNFTLSDTYITSSSAVYYYPICVSAIRLNSSTTPCPFVVSDYYLSNRANGSATLHAAVMNESKSAAKLTVIRAQILWGRTY